MLRLYIAGSTPSSLLALSNLKAVLEDLPHHLETIDVLAEPTRALDDGVLVTPTLLRVAPEPLIRFVGTLDRGDAVRQALEGGLGT